MESRNRRNFFIFVLFLLVSCQTSEKEAIAEGVNTNSDKVYRRDMSISVNGLSKEGVLVVPKSSNYKIEVEGKAKIDLFSIQSCHREMFVTDIRDSGFWRVRSKVRVDYSPSPGIEDKGACPIQLGGYEKSKGRHSWALVDFETNEETLKAELSCNGEVARGRGVSICQSRAGLVQKIVFEKPVIYSPDKGCELGELAGNTLKFNIKKGVCVYYFAEIAKPHRGHRLTTIGYDDILVRIVGE